MVVVIGLEVYIKHNLKAELAGTSKRMGFGPLLLYRPFMVGGTPIERRRNWGYRMKWKGGEVGGGVGSWPLPIFPTNGHLGILVNLKTNTPLLIGQVGPGTQGGCAHLAVCW